MINALIIVAVLAFAFYIIALELFSEELYAKWENFFELMLILSGLDVFFLSVYLLIVCPWITVVLAIICLLFAAYYQVKPLWLNFITRYEYYS